MFSIFWRLNYFQCLKHCIFRCESTQKTKKKKKKKKLEREKERGSFIVFWFLTKAWKWNEMVIFNELVTQTDILGGWNYYMQELREEILPTNSKGPCPMARDIKHPFEPLKNQTLWVNQRTVSKNNNGKEESKIKSKILNISV